MTDRPDATMASTGGGPELATLLNAAQAVLESRNLADVAAAVLAGCKKLLDAEAGLFALATRGGKGFELALRDPGAPEIELTGDLPACLLGLSVRAAQSGRAAFANSLVRAAADLPAVDSRQQPENALLAPILVAGKLAAVVAVVNKPAGFSEIDGQLAELLAGMAAVSIRGYRTVDGLESELLAGASKLLQSEENFQNLIENLPDIVARFDSELRFLYVSPAIEILTGIPARDYQGRTNNEMGTPADLAAAWDAALRDVIVSRRPAWLELNYPLADGFRLFDCRLVPLHQPESDELTVLSVARDVTDRWLAHIAERHARATAEALREATVALTRSLDRETVLTTLLDRLRQIVPYDRASVMLLEAPSRIAVRAIFDGNSAVPLEPGAGSLLDIDDHPVVRGILATGTPVLVPDVRERPDWSLPLDRASEASWMGVPLYARGNVAGLLAVSKREPDYFKEEHVKLAEALSSQASVAVENAVLFAETKVSAARLQALSRRLVEMQESERRKIAIELHDESAQALTSLRFGLQLLEREIAEGANVVGRVAELKTRIDAVIDGLRRLAADLRPASLEHLGLESALREYARSAALKFGLAVHFKARGFPRQRLPAEVETAIYRVVQEAVTNIARHADTGRADVFTEHRGDRVVVVVEDAGVGFDVVQASSRESSVGLLGMRERAETLGGSLMIESAPGRGTTVVVEVPVGDPYSAR